MANWTNFNQRTDAEARDGASARGRAALYLWARDNDDVTRAVLRRLEVFASDLGYTVAMRYVERPVDARRSPRRRRMLQGAAAKHFEFVVVETVDALGIGPASVLRVASCLAADDVHIVSRGEPWFDLGSPPLKWLARAERRRLDHGAETREVKRVRGERLGEIPYGFGLAPDGVTLVRDDDEQRAIRHARYLHVRGMSLRRIAQALSEQGYVSRVGTPLTHRQVARMLRTRGLGDPAMGSEPDP
jgi:hypothetical protein